MSLEQWVSMSSGLIGAVIGAIAVIVSNFAIAKMNHNSSDKLTEKTYHQQINRLLFENRLDAIIEIQESLAKFALNFASFQQKSYNGIELYPNTSTAGDLSMSLHKILDLRLKYSFYLSLFEPNEFQDAYTKFQYLTNLFITTYAPAIEKNECNVQQSDGYTESMNEIVTDILKRIGAVTITLSAMVTSEIPENIEFNDDFDMEKCLKETIEISSSYRLPKLLFKLKTDEANRTPFDTGA